MHIPTCHTGQLPAAKGMVTKALDTKATLLQLKRAQALVAFDQFLNNPANNLRYLKGYNTKIFTAALISVPDSNRVKLMYRLGI